MRLLLSGGGTGGHIYPALAIARAVAAAEPGTELLYLGTADGLEATIVPGQGIPFEAIPSRGMVGKGMAGLPGAALTALRGVAAARRVIRRFRPDAVLGTGGYVAGPVALAARLEHVPLVIHELNAFPGTTNRLAARWAAAVAVPFAEAARYLPKGARVAVTGNPIRDSVVTLSAEEARRILGLEPDGQLVYLVGGSRGAQVLCQAIVGALPAWLARPGLRVLFVTGQRYYEEVRRALAEAGIALQPGGQLRLVPYLDRADAAFAVADVVVTRAGGSTLAEITARGVPAVIVPSPNVTHNHQEFNARVLERAGAARVILEKDLTPARLGSTVVELLADPGLRARMRQASLGLGRPGAAADIARLVLDAAGRKRRRAR